MTFFPGVFLVHLAGHIVCTIQVFISAVFCENNWLRQFCWHASTIHVGLYYYFPIFCFSLGTEAQPELGNTQERFFLFRLIWMTSPTSKQMKEQVSEGWGLGGGWSGVLLWLHRITELEFWEKQFTWKRTKYEREISILSFSLHHSDSIRMPDTHTDGFQVLWDATHHDQCDDLVTMTLQLLARSHRNCPINWSIIYPLPPRFGSR